jgi:hypothetical protein
MLPLLLCCCCPVYMRRLILSNIYTAGSLAKLPAAQLQQLRFNVIDAQELPLGHLTNVTLLECIE